MSINVKSLVISEDLDLKLKKIGIPPETGTDNSYIFESTQLEEVLVNIFSSQLIEGELHV